MSQAYRLLKETRERKNELAGNIAAVKGFIKNALAEAEYARSTATVNLRSIHHNEDHPQYVQYVREWEEAHGKCAAYQLVLDQLRIHNL